MPVGQGLLLAGGLGEGLMKGVEAYGKARQQGIENERNKRMQGLLAAKAGYQFDPDTGEMQHTQLGAAQEESGLAQATAQKGEAQYQTASLDPDHPVSVNKREQTRAALNQVTPGMGDNLISDGMSAHEIDNNKFIPAVMHTTATLKAQALQLQKLQTMLGQKYDKDVGSEFDKIRKDTDWKEASHQENEAKSLGDQADLARTNPRANSQLPIQVARTMVNRINREEIKASTGGQDAEDVATRMVNRWVSGTMTDEDYKQMKDWVSLLGRNATTRRENIEDAYTGSFARRKKMDPEDAAQTILGQPSHATLRKQKLSQAQAQAQQQGPQPLPPGATSTTSRWTPSLENELNSLEREKAKGSGGLLNAPNR